MFRRSPTFGILPRLVFGFAPSVGMAGAVQAGPVGPTSTLYIDVFSNKSLFAIQGQNVSGPAPTYCNHCEIPIAVDGDIRTMPNFGFGNGGQYNLDLSQTGTTYGPAFPGNGGLGFRDGATDGHFNYSVGNDGVNPSIVYAFDRTWGEPDATVHDRLGCHHRGYHV